MLLLLIGATISGAVNEVAFCLTLVLSKMVIKDRLVYNAKRTLISCFNFIIKYKIHCKRQKSSLQHLKLA